MNCATGAMSFTKPQMRISAIRILEQNQDIQILFTDIDMPGSMDGLRLSAAVRDRWPPVKIIITSGKQRPAPRPCRVTRSSCPSPTRSRKWRPASVRSCTETFVSAVGNVTTLSRVDEAPRRKKDVVEHGGGQHARVRVVSRAVIAGKQRQQSGCCTAPCLKGSAAARSPSALTVDWCAMVPSVTTASRLGKGAMVALRNCRQVPISMGSGLFSAARNEPHW